jgi:cystathionine beta-lyase
MKYNFDERIDRRSSDSGKWNYYEEGVIPMWVADMDFVSPEPVVRALRGRAEHGIFGYPISASEKPEDTTEMRSLLAERLERRYGWQVQPEEIVYIPGVVNGFNLACHALAEERGGVLVQPPVYHPMLHAPENAGLQRQEAPLIRQVDGRYTIDFDAFESAIDDHTRLFILCNPHNPVGRVYRPEELYRLAEICLRKGVVICSDEIHCDLLYAGQKHTPIASLDPEVARNTITLMAPTKAFNLPGLQFAFAVIPDPALRARYMGSGKGLLGWINLMGWTAAKAAYENGQDWLDQLLSYLEGNRDYLLSYVGDNLPGIHMVKPEGTYLAWLDCRDLNIEGKLDEFFLKNARVAIADGAMFGQGGEGFARLNYGCPRSVLEEALERIRLVLG